MNSNDDELSDESENTVPAVVESSGGGGNRRPNRALIAAGASGFKAGQLVNCTVGAPEPGGYSVTIENVAPLAFLPTESFLVPGTKLVAHYVCVSGSRMLLQVPRQHEPGTKQA